MISRNLYQKLWDFHTVDILPSGHTQLFIDLHLVHEVTSPQAFNMLKERGIKVKYPSRTFAVADHIVPTIGRDKPFSDLLAKEMLDEIEINARDNKINYLGIDNNNQGIVHVVAPELGLITPGMTIACGDSHTSTHGAFGTLAFGIGTSQVRDVLATQSLSMLPLKVCRINIDGLAPKGIYSKDIILSIIRKIGVNGGIGFAFEYGGSIIKKMNMEERMTICNMTIEGGARVGYINPDEITFDYLNSKNIIDSEYNVYQLKKDWGNISSDKNAYYDKIIDINVENLAPMITWGITPAQSINIDERIPLIKEFSEDVRDDIVKTLGHMGFKPGEKMLNKSIDVAFIGSCTNGRISDLREAAKFVKGNHVSNGVKALVVPGSMKVKKEAEKEGLHEIFIEAGFEWRDAGCSMCLGMNTDKLIGEELCASTSNRNFIGRQGSPKGRTLLMSPAMVAAAAINGVISDIR